MYTTDGDKSTSTRGLSAVEASRRGSGAEAQSIADVFDEASSLFQRVLNDDRKPSSAVQNSLHTLYNYGDDDEDLDENFISRTRLLWHELFQPNGPGRLQGQNAAEESGAHQVDHYARRPSEDQWLSTVLRDAIEISNAANMHNTCAMKQ